MKDLCVCVFYVHKPGCFASVALMLVFFFKSVFKTAASVQDRLAVFTQRKSELITNKQRST